MKISVSMIVKNEEACLEKCLESVKDLDEIVILDTGSTDKTSEVARRYTDKYYEDEYRWNDNFAEARNISKSKCTRDWILTIDADEWLEKDGVKKIREAIKDTYKNSVDFHVVSSNGKPVHFQPRLYRNNKDIYWKGAIHNYLNISEGNREDITIIYGHSPAHKNDPDRALRILQKYVNENSGSVREVFYLAREYSYRSNWITALYWLNIYITRWTWASELAEAYLLMSKCYWYLQQGDRARDVCLQAIKVNADFEEAIRFMAKMSGPKNRDRWLVFAETATNKDVLFNRSGEEKSADYYDSAHKTGGLSRYSNLIKKISGLAKGKVLDIGCGTASIQKYIENYHGFDFSPEAVKIANNPNVWLGNIEDKYSYEGAYDTYIAIEVLEHLKEDCKIFQHIPKGKKFIFSVPSFSDPAHVRTFTELIVKARYKEFIDISKVIRFNLGENIWIEGGKDTADYILLVEAIRK